MHIIDLRSDTVTRPTAAMRRAMAAAEVGDDVMGEDPTINRLEEMAAHLLGKEAALLVSSGTQGNLVSMLAHCGRGDEAIMGDQSHTFRYEQGGCAALGGIMPQLLRNQPDGTLSLAEVAAAVRPLGDDHMPLSRLVCIENTQNRCGGVPLSVDYTRRIAALAHAHGLRLHVDGARLFNAAVALQVDVKELVADADSVTFCLSKGLAAPVGSVVCGSQAFVQQARRARKVLGGGMRQAGVIAAAGIVALTKMVDRLAEDHANATRLAQGLAGLSGITVEDIPLRTNLVFFQVNLPHMDAAALVAELQREGVLMFDMAPTRVRAVTHYEITAADIDRTLAVIGKVVAGVPV